MIDAVVTGASRVADPEAANANPAEQRARLAEATQQMEGVFVQYLLKALRETVPNGGHANAPGAEVFGALLDEHLAQVVADDTRTGIAEALYRQLSGEPIAASEPRDTR